MMEVGSSSLSFCPTSLDSRLKQEAARSIKGTGKSGKNNFHGSHSLHFLALARQARKHDYPSSRELNIRVPGSEVDY